MNCLTGAWVVIVGASQTEIWTDVLANTLVPGALSTKRDAFNIDGMFTQMIDVVIEDGEVIYRNVVVDEWTAGQVGPGSYQGQRMRAVHTWSRDQHELRVKFAQVRHAPKYSPRSIRITNFLAEYWDGVPLALEAVQNASAWREAPVTVIVSIGLWYVNSFNCPPNKVWCATRPPYTDLTMHQLLKHYNHGLESALAKLEPFCSANGPARKLGCTVTSIDHCKYMSSKIWHSVYEVVRRVMVNRSSQHMRFVDLWTLTSQLPENCLGGHQTPMSTLWTWQIMLAGMCDGIVDASEGTLASFHGPTCRAAQVYHRCRNPAQRGFHAQWDCALGDPCTLEAVTPHGEVKPTGSDAEVHAPVAENAENSAKFDYSDESWLWSYGHKHLRDITACLCFVGAGVFVMLALHTVRLASDPSKAQLLVAGIEEDEQRNLADCPNCPSPKMAEATARELTYFTAQQSRRYEEVLLEMGQTDDASVCCRRPVNVYI